MGVTAMTFKIPRKTKAMVQRSAKFNRYAAALLRKLGASYQPSTTGLDDPDMDRGTYLLPTSAGALCLHLYGTWVPCRFENVRAACEMLGVGPHDHGTGLNPYSGKFNVHFDDDWSVEQRLSALRRHLRRIPNFRSLAETEEA